MIKTLLCTIVKNENNYLQEFINHYKQLKVTKILIYDNNDINGEIINIEDNDVEIINVRGKKNCQYSIYNECYDKYKKHYDWILFFDCDEFLFLDKQFNNISEYLSLNIFNNYDCIKVNWKLFGDNDIEYLDNNYSVIDRFKNPVLPLDFKLHNSNIPQNCHIKSIIKCNDNLIVNFKNPHFAFGNLRYCNNKGEFSNQGPYNNIDYTYAWINHYYTKTVNEYINKIARGWPDGLKVDLKEQLYKFFDYNKKTEYKEQQITKYIEEKMDKKIKIFVCAHKEFNTSILPDKHYEVINLKDCNNKLNELEKTYSEGYQIYEIFKNKDIDNYDYIGICHYRRYYDISIDEILKLMETYDCIVTSPVNLGTQTIYQQYYKTFDKQDIKDIGSVIKHNYNEYLSKFIEVMNNKIFYGYNMCIMKTKDFKAYCEWVFDILDKFCEKHNWKIYSDVCNYISSNKNNIPNMCNTGLDPYFTTVDYNARICGHLLERLMNVYIQKNFNNIKEVPLKLIK